MGDGSAIGGWILAAAIITVLAGGANAAGRPAGSGDSASSSGSGGSAKQTTSATRTTGTTGNETAGSSTTGRGTTRAAVPCTAVSTVRSADGKRYRQLPVSAAGSYLCGLEPGDSGRPVMVLQQALAKCSNRTVKVDGIYGVGTRATVRGEQRRQLVPTPDGVYGPGTAKGMRWPWFTRSTNTFTGGCGPA